MKVYLCGPINGCTDEQCINWRESAKAVLPDTVDPMRRDFRGREDDCAAEIVEGDKEDIDGCDGLLVNYDKPSVGTSMEVLYAFERGILIVIVATPGVSISPWLRYHADYLVNTFSEAFEILLAHKPVLRGL